LLPIKEQEPPPLPPTHSSSVNTISSNTPNINTQALAKAVLANMALPVQLSRLALSPAQLLHLGSLPPAPVLSTLPSAPDITDNSNRITQIEDTDNKDRKSSVSSTSSGNNNSNNVKRNEVYV
jgi:hypothetical protein